MGQAWSLGPSPGPPALGLGPGPDPAFTSGYSPSSFWGHRRMGCIERSLVQWLMSLLYFVCFKVVPRWMSVHLYAWFCFLSFPCWCTSINRVLAFHVSWWLLLGFACFQHCMGHLSNIMWLGASTLSEKKAWVFFKASTKCPVALLCPKFMFCTTYLPDWSLSQDVGK